MSPAARRIFGRRTAASRKPVPAQQRGPGKLRHHQQGGRASAGQADRQSGPARQLPSGLGGYRPGPPGVFALLDLLALPRRVLPNPQRGATTRLVEPDIIVFSPLRAAGRCNSDIAHEIAHLMLRHDLSEVRDLNGMPFRTCRPYEEEEAIVFGGTLLLPRPVPLTAARRKATVEQIAA